MSGRDHGSPVDTLAQLRRRWLAVLAGAILGFVVSIALSDVMPSFAGAPPVVRLTLVGALVLIGAAIGFVCALILLSLRPVITTVDDVRRLTGLPVLGQLPSMRLDADDFDLTSEDARGASHRLRTALRETVMNARALQGGALPRRVVLARPEAVGESAGVDGGLARALVESGIVAGVVHSDFDSRMASRPDTMPVVPLNDGQWTDPAGYQHLTVPERVSSAPRSERLGAVERYLTTLGERYEVLVAQTSTESLPLDLRTVAPIADAVLIVVQSNRTTEESLLAIVSELLSLDVTPLGVVMTSVAPRNLRLLRRTWSPSDIQERPIAGSPSSPLLAPSPPTAAPESPVVAPLDEPLSTPQRAGFSIADLARQAEEAASTPASASASASSSSPRESS